MADENMNKSEMEKKYAQAMIENELFSVVFAEKEEDRTEERAQEMVKEIDSAAGVAVFKDDNGNEYWGVLIDKVREAKKHIKSDPPTDEDAVEAPIEEVE